MEYILKLTKEELNFIDEAYQDALESDVAEGYTQGTLEDLGLKIIQAREDKE